MQAQTGLDLKLSQCIDHTQALHSIYKPLFFRHADPDQRKALELLLDNQSNVQVFDYIKDQVAEFVKCRQPTLALFPPAALEKAIQEEFGDTSSHDYGVWVYYPWSAKLIHLLDEPAFTEVRTNRNKHKITASEQALLATKKIGVMGLSVGQSVALTLAMERGFGELRIADFDEIDLSNINRIRTGLHHLKIKKTVVVAREIAEIDPFLKVVCFEEGITKDNIHSFFTDNGKLDLLIDECDSFDIKINSRKLAKSLGIPVLMEGSDRSTIDIERFDLEPDRPVLHGMVDHLDMSKYDSLTSMDERVPYITAVTGVETLSPRMKASAVELMATISTWPQLASAVTYGGGVTADLSRRILLDQLHVSGRYFLDLEELISNHPLQPSQQKELQAPGEAPLLSTEEAEKLVLKHAAHFPEGADVLTEDQLLQLVKAVSQAPSGGNNQPWHLHDHHGLLHLLMNKKAAFAYLDPDGVSSFTSLGAAIENILLEAARLGLETEWALTPDLAPDHIAWFKFKQGYSPTPLDLQLAAQIPFRHTNRKIVTREELPETDRFFLHTLVDQIPGAQLKWVTDVPSIQAIAGISAQADLLRMFIPEAHIDFITREMRWNQDQVAHSEDGIGIHTLDLSNNDLIGIRLLRDRRMIDFLQQIQGGSGFKRLSMQQFASASALGLISTSKNDLTAYLNGGRATEKLWLGAASLGWQIHPLNVPLLFFYKNNHEHCFNPTIESQLHQAEQKLRSIFGSEEKEELILMFRIFKSSPSPERTIRKNTQKIYSRGRA